MTVDWAATKMSEIKSVVLKWLYITEFQHKNPILFHDYIIFTLLWFCTVNIVSLARALSLKIKVACLGRLTSINGDVSNIKHEIYSVVINTKEFHPSTHKEFRWLELLLLWEHPARCSKVKWSMPAFVTSRWLLVEHSLFITTAFMDSFIMC